MKKYIILSALLCSTFCISAQENLPQEVLTLEQCRDMALQHNKELAAARRQTAVASYTVKSYRGNFFPDFTANATGLYGSADGTLLNIPGGNLPVLAPNASAGGQLMPNGNYAYFPGIDLNYRLGGIYLAGIQVQQPLYMGGKIRAAYKMSLLGREMAQANETLTTNDIILKTDEAYAQLVKAGEMQQVAQRYHALLTELMKTVESAHRNGLKPKNDVMKVQVKLNESELALRKAENAGRLASMNLCHHIGLPLRTQVSVSNMLPMDDELALTSGSEASGALSAFGESHQPMADITARPEYDLLDKQVAIARQQVKLERSALLPKVGVQGAYTYLHGLEINDKPLFDQGSFSVMLNVSLPLFHFGERTNKVRAAKAKLEQTRLQRESQNELMQLELMQASNQLDEARLEQQLAERSLQQAEENMRVSRKQYEVGLETLSDHLEAQALWQQAYETKVDATFQLYLKHIAYKKAAGTLQP